MIKIKIHIAMVNIIAHLYINQKLFKKLLGSVDGKRFG